MTQNLPTNRRFMILEASGKKCVCTPSRRCTGR